MVDQLIQIVQLVVAAGLGAAVGYQREAVDRPAGLRTHTLVSLAACLMTMLGFSITGDNVVDQTRIAAGVVTGIGFLGAGTIIRQGSAVRGLTTAASIFTVAGIGLAIGGGLWVPAIAATALVLGILAYGKRVEVHFIPHESHKGLALRAANDPNLIGLIEEKLRANRVTIRGVRAEEEENGQEVIIHLDLRLPPSADPTEILQEVSNIPAISEIAWRD